MEASLDWREVLGLVLSRLEKLLVGVWSETRRLARLSGREEMVSAMSSLARLGLGAIV